MIIKERNRMIIRECNVFEYDKWMGKNGMECIWVRKEWERMEWNQVTLIECFKIREWKWMKINGM